MSDAPAITMRREGSIAIATLSNPKRRNAFTPQMRLTLTEALEAAARDEGVRAVILQGEGDHFCAGADLSRIDDSAPPPTPLYTRENMKQVHRLTRVLAAGPKPVVAAVEGVAAGGGFALALACDHIVAAENARFVSAFGKLGLVGDMGIMWALAQRLSPAAAKRILVRPSEISGTQAGALGIADDVVSSGEAFERAWIAAEELASLAPLTFALTKSAFAAGLDAALATELDLVPIANQSDDFKARLASFMQK